MPKSECLPASSANPGILFVPASCSDRIRSAPRSTAFVCLVVVYLVANIGCKPQEQVDRERAEKAATQAPVTTPEPAAQKAEVGVGVKGDSLDSVDDNTPGGIIAAPVKAYFRTKERVVFDIQIPQMLQLYKALHGKGPQSHEAFMNEIAAQKIALPKLPAGMKYQYRVDVEELWVEPDKPAE